MFKVKTAIVTSAVFLFGLTSVAWSADKVLLTYGWKPGVVATVSGYQMSDKFVNGAAEPGTKIVVGYQMVTRPHENGLEVDYEDVSMKLETDDPRLQGWMKTYMEAISGSIPAYLINESGEIVGATNIPELRASLTSTISDLLTDLPDEQKQQIIGSLEQLYSEEMLNAQLATTWNMNVAQWIGAELEDDGVYQMEYETPVPVLGNQMVKTNAEFEFAGRVNCNDADKDKACVNLLFRSTTDNVAMKALLENVFPAGEDIPEVKLDVIHSLELVVDPSTLMPFYTKHTQHTSSPVQMADGMVNTTKVDTSEYFYQYGEPAK